jgi:hypothetical protein
VALWDEGRNAPLLIAVRSEVIEIRPKSASLRIFAIFVFFVKFIDFSEVFEKKTYRLPFLQRRRGPPNRRSDRGPPARHRYAIQSVSFKTLSFKRLHVIPGFHPSSN